LFDTEDWPDALAHLRRGLRWKYIAMMLAHYLFWYAVLIVPIFAFDPFGMVAFIRSTWGKVGHGALIGACAGVAQVAALLSTRGLLYRVSRDTLRAHGFCVCGYPGQQRGGELLCPECGRTWPTSGKPRE
jgi:hypothetical protein